MLKKALLAFYLLLIAALLLLPVPDDIVVQAEPQPSDVQPASPAPTAPLKTKEKSTPTSSPPEEAYGEDVYGRLTRLYAPPVPGMSSSGRENMDAADMTVGVSTANIPPGEASPDGRYLSELETQLFQAVNAWREQEGQPALHADSALQRCARLRAKEMAQSGCFSHTRPDGTPWSTALPSPEALACPLRGEIFGTALGASPQRAAGCWLQEWEQSPSEKENICLPDFEFIGIGAYSCIDQGETLTCAVLLFAGNHAG